MRVPESTSTSPLNTKNSDSQSRVTVVVPTFRGAEHLERSLSSIARQTHLPDKVIVVDDCSADNTVSVARSILNKHGLAFDVLSSDTNSGGPCTPTNIGIAKAETELIAILEQDDEMLPCRLEKQVKLLKTRPEVALAIGRYEIANSTDPGELPRGYRRPQLELLELTEKEKRLDTLVVSPQRAISALLQHNFTISNSNFCFRKTDWEECGRFDPNIKTVGDLDFALRMMTRGSMGIVNSTTLSYWFNESSLNRSDKDRVRIEGQLVRMNAVCRDPSIGRECFEERGAKMVAEFRDQLFNFQLRRAFRAFRELYRTRTLHAMGAVRRGG